MRVAGRPVYEKTRRANTRSAPDNNKGGGFLSSTYRALWLLGFLVYAIITGRRRKNGSLTAWRRARKPKAAFFYRGTKQKIRPATAGPLL
jgi:hypothetical protein